MDSVPGLDFWTCIGLEKDVLLLEETCNGFVGFRLGCCLSNSVSGAKSGSVSRASGGLVFMSLVSFSGSIWLISGGAGLFEVDGKDSDLEKNTKVDKKFLIFPRHSPLEDKDSSSEEWLFFHQCNIHGDEGFSCSWMITLITFFGCWISYKNTL